MDAGHVITIYRMLKAGGRITVRRIQEEAKVSKCTVYRTVQQIARVMPVEIENGVVVIRDQSRSKGNE